jgi:small subunit ribosomal protein S9
MVTKDNYIEAKGRRKTATARVRITPASKESFTINGRAMTEYFPTKEMQILARAPLTLTATDGTLAITVNVAGGGIHSQAEAVSHSLARVLIKYKEEFKPAVKKAKLLTRDDREKERRKFGLKKARKAPQWSKR